jgi:hypothetical protein
MATIIPSVPARTSDSSSSTLITDKAAYVENMERSDVIFAAEEETLT